MITNQNNFDGRGQEKYLGEKLIHFGEQILFFRSARNITPFRNTFFGFQSIVKLNCLHPSKLETFWRL